MGDDKGEDGDDISVKTKVKPGATMRGGSSREA